MIDAARLDEILEVLQDRGVSNFSCPEFTVTLALVPDEDEQMQLAKALAEAKKAAPSGPYAHPSLWPNGTPPKFPGTAE